MITQLRMIGPRPGLLAETVAHRISSRLSQRRLRVDYARVVAGALPPGRLRLPEIDIPPASALPAPLELPAAALVDEAEHVAAHRVELLGSGLVDLGASIDWHRDVKSGYAWPAVFYQDIDVIRADASDAKVPWDLSRGHHLLTLARAWRLTGDERFAHELERQLRSWLAANPPGVGINWANAMEVALRAVNWVWAIATLEGTRPLEPSLRRDVAASLQVHGRHIRANLEGAPYLRSNHYLSDVLGLFVLGSVIEGDEQALEWREYGRRALEREIVSQVHGDGVGFEASTAYHGLALEMFLIARRVAALDDEGFSDRFDARLGRMLAYSAAIRHPDGRTPRFGDDDSGRVLPGGFARRPTQDHLLWLGAALLGGGAPVPGTPHEEVAWTLGVRAWGAVRRARSAPPPPACVAFPEGGTYVLGGGGTHLVVRCGGVGQNGNGGHAHNDVLSYELARDATLVVDAGTYVYTADADARNAFRSSVAHNVVVVDEAEANPLPAGALFELPQFARTRVFAWHVDERHARFGGAHDGFRRLPGVAEHRRGFTLDRVRGDVSVIDDVRGWGRHQLESRIHFAPETEVRPAGERALVAERGPDAVRIVFWGDLRDPVVEDRYVSDSYGIRELARAVRVRGNVNLPARFGYTFVPVGHAERA